MTALRSRRGRASGAGFSLLEVMVALAVLATSFLALAELSGAALRNHSRARDLSDATLLARGKLAELEERYEDVGFKDFDEDDEGDFRDAGRPDVRWRVELVRPDPNLSADQLVATLAGAEGGDTQALLAKLFGGGDDRKAGDGKSVSGPKTTTGAAGAMAGQMLTAQLTAFGEQLKKALREMRLTVSWNDGKPQGFTVTEHLVVLNPRAPGGARGDSPDLPPNLTAGAGAAAAALRGMPGMSGSPTPTPTPTGRAR